MIEWSFLEYIKKKSLPFESSKERRKIHRALCFHVYNLIEKHYYSLSQPSVMKHYLLFSFVSITEALFEK